jgi:hypothetical protein
MRRCVAPREVRGGEVDFAEVRGVKSGEEVCEEGGSERVWLVVRESISRWEALRANANASTTGGLPAKRF